MTVNFQPLGDKVLIKPDPRPTQTASGLQLVEHWTPEQTGVVVSLGRDAKDPEFQVGDRVLFGWQFGQELCVDGEKKYLLMRAKDVLAVIDYER